MERRRRVAIAVLLGIRSEAWERSMLLRKPGNCVVPRGGGWGERGNLNMDSDCARGDLHNRYIWYCNGKGIYVYAVIGQRIVEWISVGVIFDKGGAGAKCWVPGLAWVAWDGVGEVMQLQTLRKSNADFLRGIEAYVTREFEFERKTEAYEYFFVSFLYCLVSEVVLSLLKLVRVAISISTLFTPGNRSGQPKSSLN